LLERIRAEKQQMVKDGKLKPKDIKNNTIIFVGEDNLHYEKFQDGTVKCIEDEIPFELPEETLKWLCETQRTSGYLFLNRYGDRITTRGISQQLKNYADKYGLDSKVVYPHSFRHRYAKNFLEKYNDIALLVDLMGHESIETTRIYLRRTASEQQALVDKIVTW
jgi:integrase